MYRLNIVWWNRTKMYVGELEKTEKYICSKQLCHVSLDNIHLFSYLICALFGHTQITQHRGQVRARERSLDYGLILSESASMNTFFFEK